VSIPKFGNVLKVNVPKFYSGNVIPHPLKSHRLWLCPLAKKSPFSPTKITSIDMSQKCFGRQNRWAYVVMGEWELRVQQARLLVVPIAIDGH
jgi:hypothetical protein